MFQVYGKAAEGELLGEIGVMCNSPQPFTFRTSKLSQILSISRPKLMEIIQENGAEGQIIRSNIQQVNTAYFFLTRGLRETNMTVSNFSNSQKLRMDQALYFQIRQDGRARELEPRLNP
jgi:potassium channel